ncbi:MAG: hypothetical protein IPI81_09280 [Flavobacteriales bacterium]|nr:hypothetical protein [Flavobacteriales bacterium]MCC6937519.1 hypothetical protein [Flavobacteriales bacterium]
MNTSAIRYEKLKNTARSLMLAGNVERYMHALRLISSLRVQGPIVTA